MSDAAPLPCPFCGGSVEVSNRSPTDRALQIYCGECEFAIGGWTYEEGVIEAWNRRTSSAEPELRVEVERLRTLLREEIHEKDKCLRFIRREYDKYKLHFGDMRSSHVMDLQAQIISLERRIMEIDAALGGGAVG